MTLANVNHVNRAVFRIWPQWGGLWDGTSKLVYGVKERKENILVKPQFQPFS